jgi:hypothetical protein
MTYPATQAKAGPALYIAAVATVAAALFAAAWLVSLLFAGLDLGAVRALGAVSIAGLIVAAPVAIAASLLVRCRACERLLLPLVYDGKSLFAARSPSAVAIVRTALGVALHRRAACPHCGAEAQV